MNASAKIVASSPRDAFGSQMVLLQNDAGYWNVTSMGDQGGRQWKYYCKTQGARTFAASYAAELGVPESELMYYEQPTVKGQGGVTWVRRRIALRFLGELSAGFANWAFGVIERYVDGEITTEESKAAKRTVDGLLEQGRIRYEQAQKQLRGARADLEHSERKRLDAEATTKKFWRQVDHATAEVDDLRKQLGEKRQAGVKRKRGQECKVFLQELSRAIMQYRDDPTGSWPEVEDALEMSIPDFCVHLQGHASSPWVGKDLAMFGELPTKKGTKQWNLLFEDPASLSCRFDGIFPARNHETRNKLWQKGAEKEEEDD